MIVKINKKIKKTIHLFKYCFIYCIVSEMKTSTFLEFIDAQREDVKRKYIKLNSNKRKLTELKSVDTGDIKQQIQQRKKIKALKDIISNHSLMSLEQFDEISEPYINYYYSQRYTEKFKSEELYINIFNKNIHPQTSNPEVSYIDVDICVECGGTCVDANDEAAMYCPDCGYTIQYLDSSSNAMAYGDTVEYTAFSYKRINHLNEWLNHFQAKEATPIPDDVLCLVMTYLKEKRIKKVEFNHVKKALTAVCPRKYYDQAMQIWCKITNKKPIRLDPECEEKIKLMFFRIQAPFEKHRPNGRCNFLSYPYVMYKFCQLLHYEHLLPYFSLLKGKRKLHNQEKIFKLICADLGWIFTPIQSHDNNGVNIDGHVLQQL
jgi:predicted RNA-binding Zn-ribbon protein involved in translation (DUF1610 family)